MRALRQALRRPGDRRGRARLAELELTPHAGGRAEVTTEPMLELEVTRFRGGADLPPVVIPEMELTRVDPASVQVDAQEIPDLERGRAPDDGVRTEIPWGAVTCRYCRNQQAEGAICDKCGMRLPRFGPDAVTAPAGAGLAGGNGQISRASVQVRRTCPAGPAVRQLRRDGRHPRGGMRAETDER